MEDKQWKWEQPEEKLESSTEKQESSIIEIINDNFDDEPVRGTRSLAEIYESSNIVICEPVKFEEAVKNNEWIEAMQEELRMIEKNDTWVLMDKPLHKKVIGVKWVYRTKQSQISCEELCSNVWSGLLRNICTSSMPRYNQITTCSVCIKEVY